MGLEINMLCVDLAGQSVLRNVNVTLESGETVAVIGRNGAGKTTLLRSVMGLIQPRSGSLVLEGEDITRSPSYRRTQMGFGYAPEDRVIFPTLTVAQNISLPCEVLKLPTSVVQQRLDFVISVVPQLEGMLSRSGAALSGGQGKMVALGRALMVGTKYVLLDEPFQGLAPALAIQYGESLRKLRLTQPDLCVVITESNASLVESIQGVRLLIERGSVTLDQACSE